MSRLRIAMIEVMKMLDQFGKLASALAKLQFSLQCPSCGRASDDIPIEEIADSLFCRRCGHDGSMGVLLSTRKDRKSSDNDD